MIVVHLRNRRIDRNLVEIGPAQASDLGIDVGVDPPGQQRIVGEVQARDDVCRAEGDLLRLGKEVIRIAVQCHATHRGDRDEFLRHELGGVQHVEAERFRLLFRKYLHAELVLRVFAGFDRLPQVPAMEIRIGAGNLDRLIPVERMRAGERCPVELDEHGLVVRVHQPECVHAKALHHAIAARDGPIRHEP